jgi:hypothetical protein
MVMDRKDAIAVVFDLDEKKLRRTLVAIVYQAFEPEGLTGGDILAILDVERG